jgi:hypothetical protein
MLAVAVGAPGCQTSPKGGAGFKLVTPLKASAAVCLAEADPEALRRILGNDEMIKKTR